MSLEDSLFRIVFDDNFWSKSVGVKSDSVKIDLEKAERVGLKKIIREKAAPYVLWIRMLTSTYYRKHYNISKIDVGGSKDQSVPKSDDGDLESFFDDNEGSTSTGWDQLSSDADHFKEIEKICEEEGGVCAFKISRYMESNGLIVIDRR
jgi:hypothetical protein